MPRRCSGLTSAQVEVAIAVARVQLHGQVVAARDGQRAQQQEVDERLLLHARHAGGALARERLGGLLGAPGADRQAAAIGRDALEPGIAVRRAQPRRPRRSARPGRRSASPSAIRSPATTSSRSSGATSTPAARICGERQALGGRRIARVDAPGRRSASARTRSRARSSGRARACGARRCARPPRSRARPRAAGWPSGTARAPSRGPTPTGRPSNHGQRYSSTVCGRTRSGGCMCPSTNGTWERSTMPGRFNQVVNRP